VGFNIVTAVAFLLVFAFLRSQPINDRAYFLKLVSWVPAALKMPKDELIEHAGLDSVIYL
jgi:hypothetical protein